MELAIKRTNGEDLVISLVPGSLLYVVGPNGSGKSALIQHAVEQIGSNNVRRISAHRQTFLENGEINTTARATSQFFRNLQRQESNPQYRYQEYDPETRLRSVLFSLAAKDNEQARRVRDLMKAGDREEASRITSSEKSPFETINALLETAALKVSIEYSDSEQILAKHASADKPYDMAQMSDGERNAVLLAAEVLTVAQGVLLLIDEPERHLHRSIIVPLLSALLDERPDSPFVISTHELNLPLSNPDAQVLMVRACKWEDNSAVAWDADLLQGKADLEEDLKRAILGSRRRILFVEGEQGSLDRQLYAALFPEISVHPVKDWNQVIYTVTGLRKSEGLHHIEGFGLIDADNRSREEIEGLTERGIFALNGYSVESIYYCSDAIKVLAKQQAEVLGGDANQITKAATSGALATLRACLRSLGYVKLRLLPRQCDHVSFLSQRHQPGAIRPDSSHIGVGPPSDQAPHRGPVRRFLRGPLLAEKRLPMADAPCGLPRLAHLLQVFPAMG